MLGQVRKLRFDLAGRRSKPYTLGILALAFFGCTLAVLCGLQAPVVYAQQTSSGSVSVIQPGAPGTPSKKLSPCTSAVAPQRSQADIEFMQGMIMHHTQAVEMTALITSQTENKDIRPLG